MLKNISNLGKTLNKVEQQAINGGIKDRFCTNHQQCPPNQCCQSDPLQTSGFCGPRQIGTGACNGQIPHDHNHLLRGRKKLPLIFFNEKISNIQTNRS